MFSRSGWLLALTLALTTPLAPAMVNAAGGSSTGGGGVKALEIRISGYITAIDYDTGEIIVGASYYNTGIAFVTKSTKISLDNVACSFDDLVVGEWTELRYDWYTKAATKISSISQ